MSIRIFDALTMADEPVAVAASEEAPPAGGDAAAPASKAAAPVATTEEVEADSTPEPEAEEEIESLVQRFLTAQQNRATDVHFSAAQLVRIGEHLARQQTTEQQLEETVKARQETVAALEKAFKEELPKAIRDAYANEMAAAEAEGRQVSQTIIDNAIQRAVEEATDAAETAVIAPHVNYAADLIRMLDGSNPVARAFLADPAGHSFEEWMNGVVNAAYTFGRNNPDPNRFVPKADAERKVRSEVDKTKPVIPGNKSESTGKRSSTLTKEEFMSMSRAEQARAWRERPDEVAALS